MGCRAPRAPAFLRGRWTGRPTAAPGAGGEGAPRNEADANANANAAGPLVGSSSGAPLRYDRARRRRSREYIPYVLPHQHAREAKRLFSSRGTFEGPVRAILRGSLALPRASERILREDRASVFACLLHSPSFPYTSSSIARIRLANCSPPHTLFPSRATADASITPAVLAPPSRRRPRGQLRADDGLLPEVPARARGAHTRTPAPGGAAPPARRWRRTRRCTIPAGVSFAARTSRSRRAAREPGQRRDAADADAL